MLHVPWVGYAFPVAPLEAICRWVDGFGDDEGSFGGRKLVQAVGLLDTP
jgi:hypothetical protein